MNISTEEIECHKHKDWLIEKYWEECFSLREIAEMCNVDAATIRYWMKKLNIYTRTKSEGCIERYKRKPNPAQGKKYTEKEKENLRTKNKKWWKENPTAQRAEKSVHWVGGRRKTTQGYILIYKPDHPNTGVKRFIPEHRFMAEQALGRLLKKGEIVHHINGKKDDNRNKNFVICTSSFHRWMERRMVELYQEEHFAHI